MDMHVFSDDDDYQVVIFAACEDRAELIYNAVADNLGLMPDGWLGSELDTWQAVGLVRHQAQAERQGKEGIGVYDPGIGWTILAIDYEKFGLLPP